MGAGVLRSVDRALELEPDHLPVARPTVPHASARPSTDPQPSTSDIVDRSVLLDRPVRPPRRRPRCARPSHVDADREGRVCVLPALVRELRDEQDCDITRWLVTDSCARAPSTKTRASLTASALAGKLRALALAPSHRVVTIRLESAYHLPSGVSFHVWATRIGACHYSGTDPARPSVEKALPLGLIAKPNIDTTRGVHSDEHS